MFDRLLGNAVLIDNEKLSKELEAILIPEEEINMGFKFMRDQIVFTDKRVIFINKQGMTGKKKEYLSVPYRSIVRFSIESAGTFDRDIDLKIWVSGMSEPIDKQLKKGSEIVVAVQRALAYYVLNR